MVSKKNGPRNLKGFFRIRTFRLSEPSNQQLSIKNISVGNSIFVHLVCVASQEKYI